MKVSSYQLLILILYNIKLSYTWLELLERTNLAEDQLSSQVAVLMKRDILIASKGSNPLNKTPAYYRLNTELECTKPKIKIDLHTRKEHIIDSKTTQKSADSDRGLVMQVRNIKVALMASGSMNLFPQAAAVRILKRSTPISENGLISEIQKYFEDKLEVTPNEVLDVIDILIQKEYILKTDGEEGMLKYLA